MGKHLRPITIDGAVAYVPLTKGYTAIIDACDVPLIEKHGWSAVVMGGTAYASACAKIDGFWRGIRMHRLLLNPPAGLYVDHINGNGVDNRRCNLRLATHAQNLRNTKVRSDNTSGLKGARRQGDAYIAQIWLNGKNKYLGSYATAQEAHAAYCEAAKLYYGEFARTG